MRKTLYFAVAAIALMGCSKTEAVYTPSSEIGFIPVSKYDTKAAVEGTSYSVDYPFYVYANAKNEGSTSFNSKYFEKVLFEPDGNTKDNGIQVYKGTPTQYWPNVNPLVFAGFTNTGNVSSITPTTNTNLTSLILSNYTQPLPTVEGDNDLMYFFADNNNNGYDKTTNFVDPTMKHACSWITININADSKLVDDLDGTREGVQAYWQNLKVTEVKFVKLHTTGTVTLTKGSPAAWDFTGQTEGSVDVKALSASAMAITKATGVEFADIAKNTIVLPQYPAYLSVTYTYTTPAGIDGFTETKVLPLNFDDEPRDQGYTDDQYRATWTKWEPGKHYIYNLTVTANEIKIAPRSEDWVTDLNGNDTDDDNIGKDI